MATGACGVNCDVCRLSLRGICSTCGPGVSEEGAKKIAAQERILGFVCPILSCAAAERVAYCPRDCDSFPCDVFRAGPYPFSETFLTMQDRRRKEPTPERAPSGQPLKVPEAHWEALAKRDPGPLCRNAVAERHRSGGFLLPFLSEHLLVDCSRRKVFRPSEGGWEVLGPGLLELLAVVYLLNAGPEPLADRMVSVNELKSAHFFQGPHELKVTPVLQRFGEDPEGFTRRAERLGGQALELADRAYRFEVFPKVVVYYLLWEGDAEFGARLSVLFDGSIERHLAADAIWGVVNLVSNGLLE